MSSLMKDVVRRRYIIRCLIGAGMVIFLSFVASLSFRQGHLNGPLAWAVAVLPALPIIWVIIETGRYLADEKDEFQRSVLVQSLLGGIGGILATTTIWGFLEDFALAPHLDLVLIYAIFWLFVCVSYPVVKLRYR
jgi:hypothetical protein